MVMIIWNSTIKITHKFCMVELSVSFSGISVVVISSLRLSSASSDDVTTLNGKAKIARRKFEQSRNIFQIKIKKLNTNYSYKNK